MQFVAFYAAAQETGALLPGASVSVYQATDPPQTTLAELYSEEGAEIGNPLIAGNSGLVGFAAADGDYDVVVSSGDEAQPSFKLYLFDPADIGASVAAAQSTADGASATATAASQTAGQATQTLSQIEQTVSDAQAQVTAAQQDASDALNQVAEANTSLLSSIANAQGQAETALLQVNENTENLVTISTTVASNTSAITTNYATLTTSVSSLTGTVDTLSSTVTANNSTQSANLTSEAVTRADADSALSSSITSLASTVGSNTASISSNYTTLTNSISALSSTVSSLSSTVGSNTASITANYGTLSGLISTQAAQITTLQSNYGSLSATVGSNYTALTTAQASTAASVTTLSASYNPNPNLISNPTWALGLSGWTQVGVAAFYSEPTNPAGPCLVYENHSGAVTTFDTAIEQTAPYPCTAGSTYSVQVGAISGGVTGGELYAGVEWNIPGSSPQFSVASIFLNVGYWARYTLQNIVAPAGATSFTAYVQTSGNSFSTSGFVGFRNFKAEQGPVCTAYSDDQTAITLNASITSEAITRSSADSSLASSITSLTTTVGSNTSTISSNYTSLTSSISSLSSTVSSLSSTVSGHTASISSQQTAISTLQSQTAIYIEAVSTSGGTTLVQLVSTSGGGTSILLQANKVYFGPNKYFDETANVEVTQIGSYIEVSGGPFGSSNQFSFWYGPNVAYSSMTEGNAIEYRRYTDGSAYFGGGITTGAYKNSLSGSSLSASLSSLVTLGPFGSRGDPITIAYTYAYNFSETVSGHQTATGSSSATVQVYLSLGSGAETLIDTLNVSGSPTSSYDAEEGQTSYTLNMGGSGTYTDSSGTTATRTVRMALSRTDGATFPGTAVSETVTQVGTLVSNEN